MPMARDQVEMIGHDDIAMQHEPLVFLTVFQTVDDDLKRVILLK